MLNYTAGEKSVIDSNLFIGTNRPLAEVTIDGNAIRVKSVDVEPMKNGAGQATIVVDNKNGIYAPDKAGVWNGVIWPNKVVTISIGYGANREPIFTGLIDTVKMKTFPQTITIQARDKLKLALDQTVTDDAGLRSLTYTDQYVEAVLKDLALRAGWSVGDIYYDDSGVIVGSITFSHETYADAMAKLCERYNYEYYAGRTGEIYFHYITDRQPEVVDESTVLNGTTAVSMAKFPVVTASIRVRSAASGGGTLYSSDTDYLITEGTKSTAWTIARRVGSTIADSGTVYVSYVYAAWVFEEGKNITSLEYTIDDVDLYTRAYVLGMTAVSDNLKYYPDVNNIVVRSAATGGTLYVLGSDYAITAGNATTPWKIARVEGSTIPAGGKVYVSYDYTVGATTYVVDDEPHTLYSTSGAECYGYADYVSAAYYNVLTDKVIIVADNTIATPEQCEEVAERLLVTLSAGARSVSFDAVAVPYLWVGDCIMIVESSSTISEIYRITDIKYKFSGSSMMMGIDAKHYGYAPA